ncbi:MAG: hypothetical protein ABJE47_19875 [bacterium]
MSDYRIEKVRHRVELTLANGSRLEGDIFLQAFARFRAGPEEPLDVLNDADAFLALVVPTGDLLVVQKSQIAVVATDLPATDESAETGVLGMRVEITLVNGETRQGSVFPEVRADRPRLVDFLNDTPLHFLPLFAAEQLLLVSRAHIAYARPTT